MTELEAFLKDEAAQQNLIDALNKFARLCSAQAKATGFTTEPQKIVDYLRVYSDPDNDGELVRWFRDCEIQAELARIASEVGEAVEAVRKPDYDTHLPQFDNFIVEMADVLIRVGDTTGRRGMDLGEATVAKMLYNASRPRKHGKGS